MNISQKHILYKLHIKHIL